MSAEVGAQAVAASTGKILVSTTTKVLGGIGAITSVALVIYGWTREHPTLEGIRKAKIQVEEHIGQLTSLSSSFDKLQ